MLQESKSNEKSVTKLYVHSNQSKNLIIFKFLLFPWFYFPILISPSHFIFSNTSVSSIPCAHEHSKKKSTPNIFCNSNSSLSFITTSHTTTHVTIISSTHFQTFSFTQFFPASQNIKHVQTFNSSLQSGAFLSLAHLSLYTYLLIYYNWSKPKKNTENFPFLSLFSIRIPPHPTTKMIIITMIITQSHHTRHERENEKLQVSK